MADRLEILKTYKTYVNGKFPRSESERVYQISNKKDLHIANACRCSRKDIREAIVASRNAFGDWSNRSAYNRGQILYRIAEMLEGRKDQFIRELENLGIDHKEALREVECSIDRLVYYGGWTDKISQVFGTVNPVASSHFNFSVPEPTGVVGIIAPESHPLLSIVTLIAPVIASGNCVVMIASEKKPLPSISFGEVLHASDLPGGVVNILSGYQNEMLNDLTSHMDVNAILNTSTDKKIMKLIDENASISVKRVNHHTITDWMDDRYENPYMILDCMEIKTTWHPIGV